MANRFIPSFAFMCIYFSSNNPAVDGFDENHQGPVIYHNPGVIPVFNGGNPVIPTQGYNTYPNPNGPIIQRIPSVGGPQDPYHNHNHNGPNANNQYDRNNGYNNAEAQYDNNGRPIYGNKQGYYQNITFPKDCREKRYRNSPNCFLTVNIIRNKNRPDWITFEVRGKTGGYGYVAVGLSDDLKMGEDHIIECIHRGYDKFDHYQSFSKGQLPPERIVDKPEIVNNFGYKFEDGYLTCTFDRYYTSEVYFNNKVYVYDLNKGDHHILMAMGSLKDSASAEKDQIGYHGKEKRFAEPSTLREPYRYRNSGDSILKQSSSLFSFFNSFVVLWLGRLIVL